MVVWENPTHSDPLVILFFDPKTRPVVPFRTTTRRGLDTHFQCEGNYTVLGLPFLSLILPVGR